MRFSKALLAKPVFLLGEGPRLAGHSLINGRRQAALLAPYCFCDVVPVSHRLLLHSLPEIADTGIGSYSERSDIKKRRGSSMYLGNGIIAFMYSALPSCDGITEMLSNGL